MFEHWYCCVPLFEQKGLQLLQLLYPKPFLQQGAKQTKLAASCGWPVFSIAGKKLINGGTT
jgi:hypothetical protein